MSAFEYKAVDSFGKVVLGRIEASNDDDLELRLTRMGLDLVDFKPARKNRLGFGRRRLSAVPSWSPSVSISNNCRGPAYPCSIRCATCATASRTRAFVKSSPP